MAGNDAGASLCRVQRIINLVGQKRTEDAAREASMLAEEAPSYRVGTCPLIAAFVRPEDRDRLVRALADAGVPV